ncbi:histone-lysine N-methyltransferase SETMAR-like [Halictus rubicundus]|uniref:histone-lysine N-methyltransferase SETMAR-like n=1 Tax=Halictus rubicundus TaxID=77578 RepID=UPI00403686AA
MRNLMQRRFAAGDYDLSDSPQSGRPVEFDNDTLKSPVEADPKLSIQELSRSLGSTWSTIQRHLHEMGKAYRHRIWTM